MWVAELSHEEPHGDVNLELDARMRHGDTHAQEIKCVISSLF